MFLQKKYFNFKRLKRGLISTIIDNIDWSSFDWDNFSSEEILYLKSTNLTIYFQELDQLITANPKSSSLFIFLLFASVNRDLLTEFLTASKSNSHFLKDITFVLRNTLLIQCASKHSLSESLGLIQRFLRIKCESNNYAEYRHNMDTLIRESGRRGFTWQAKRFYKMFEKKLDRLPLDMCERLLGIMDQHRDIIQLILIGCAVKLPNLSLWIYTLRMFDIIEFAHVVVNPHLLQSFDDVVFIMTNIENNNVGVYIESINKLAANVYNFSNINNIDVDTVNTTVDQMPQQNTDINTSSKIQCNNTFITASIVVFVAVGFCYFLPYLAPSVLGVGAQMVPPVPS